MKVAIIGMGHVGLNVRSRLTEVGVETVTYDPAYDVVYPREALTECEFAIVCVGTPRSTNGSACLDQVEKAISELPTEYILLRSTVPPGTVNALVESTGRRVCFSPEYVGEAAFSQGTWASWAHDQAFQILGGERTTTSWFASRLTGLYGPETIMFQCGALEAEIIKYMENCYFATKVTFVNEFFELCREMDADWHSVREGWLMDPRINRDHTAVFVEDRGFGGRCLPKDLDAILSSAAELGVSTPLLDAVRMANHHYRSMNG